MATDLIQAADDARRLLRVFKAFAEVVAALEATGQLELRAAEAAKTLEGLQAQMAEVTAKTERAKVAGFAHTEQATLRADEILAEAAEKAEKTVADANAKADIAVEAAAGNVARQNALAEMAKAGAKEAEAERDKLLAEVDALEKRLARAQASIAKLLG